MGVQTYQHRPQESQDFERTTNPNLMNIPLQRNNQQPARGRGAKRPLNRRNNRNRNTNSNRFEQDGHLEHIDDIREQLRRLDEYENRINQERPFDIGRPNGRS